MYSSQKGECSICSVPIKLESEKRSETACVDHCHKTGKVRSLLCNSCNVLLGAAKDRIDILIKSIEYLKRYE
jgi:hypothetical protein